MFVYSIITNMLRVRQRGTITRIKHRLVKHTKYFKGHKQNLPFLVFKVLKSQV